MAEAISALRNLGYGAVEARLRVEPAGSPGAAAETLILASLREAGRGLLAREGDAHVGAMDGWLVDPGVEYGILRAGVWAIAPHPPSHGPPVTSRPPSRTAEIWTGVRAADTDVLLRVDTHRVPDRPPPTHRWQPPLCIEISQ